MLEFPSLPNSAAGHGGHVVLTDVYAHNLLWEQVIERRHGGFLLDGNVQLPVVRLASAAMSMHQIAFRPFP